MQSITKSDNVQDQISLLSNVLIQLIKKQSFFKKIIPPFIQSIYIFHVKETYATYHLWV